MLEHKLVTDDKSEKSSVYSGAQTCPFIVVTSVNKNGFAPGPAYVLVKKDEFSHVRELVKKTQETGTKRQTAQGKLAIDGVFEDYNVSIVTLDNGKLVEVTANTGELAGMSIRWIVDAQDNVAFKSNDKYFWFSPSGATSFDFGFKRIQAKIGEQKLDSVKREYVTEFGEPKYLTIPNGATVDAFEKATKGMRILDSIISYAQSKLAPVNQTFEAVPDFGTADGFEAV
jgi:hypothetical protein